MSAKEHSEAQGRGAGCLGSLLMLGLVIAVFAVTAAAVFLRTREGRRLVEERVGQWSGMSLSIQDAGLGLPCCVVLRGVSSGEADLRGEPLFRAREVRVGVSSGLRWSIEADHPELTLVRREDGTWAPGSLGCLGELPEMRLSDLGRLTAALRTNTSVRVKEGMARWTDGEGRELLTATGLQFTLTPVAVPERLMYHYSLAIQAIVRKDGSRMHDVTREWLSSDELPYVELKGSGEQEGGSPE